VARQQADSVSPTTPSPVARGTFERSGAAQALLDARREHLTELEQKAAVKDAQARDLRRQIEELRAQLARYAEALEEDLTQGREKVAARIREGLAFEKAFGECSTLLLNHLKGKAEVRDLLQDLMANMHGQTYSSNAQVNSNRGGSGPDSRGP